MTFRDLFFDVLHTLWSNKLRTFLTMFGIAWGIVSIVLMVGAGEGFQRGNQKMQETFGRDELLRIYGQQVRLTVECLRRMSHNAALLQQVSYAQLNSGNQLIASLAQEMVDAGVHVRLYTFMALIVLQVRGYLQMVPLFSAVNTGDVRSIVASSLMPAYALLKDKAGHLTCLKFSSLHELLAQSL